MSEFALKYMTNAFTASAVLWKMPGTGPERSETLARTILSSVMPVPFLNPLQLILGWSKIGSGGSEPSPPDSVLLPLVLPDGAAGSGAGDVASAAGGSVDARPTGRPPPAAEPSAPSVPEAVPVPLSVG